jgi:preprotein translocase subunit Sec61beta
VRLAASFDLCFIYGKGVYFCMAKKSGGRLVSSAGLVNYYDSEDHRAIHISPVAVIIVTAVTGVAVFILNALF